MATIKPLNFERDEDLAQWQAYILAHPDTQYADLGAWRRVYADLYGIRNVSFIGEENGKTVGVVSLYLIASPFFGRLLVTCPFFGSGGLYADSPAVRNELLAAVQEAARDVRADFIEFRLREPLDSPYQVHRDFQEWDMPIDAPEETIWKETLASNVRQNIRKSEKHPLTFSIGQDPTAPYDLISTTIRDLGTPFHGRRFFELMVKHLGDAISFSQVHLDERLIAAGVVVTYRDRLSTPYIGSLKTFRDTRANYSQYWGLVKHGREHGIHWFDMGRSPRDSTHQKFKEKWGAKAVAVHYAHQTLSPKKTYRTVLEPSRLETLASDNWKRLPVALTRRLGPWLARSIP